MQRGFIFNVKVSQDCVCRGQTLGVKSCTGDKLTLYGISMECYVSITSYALLITIAFIGIRMHASSNVDNIAICIFMVN